MRAAWEVVGKPARARGRVRARLADWLGLTALRHDVNTALDQQRELNAAVTRAFEIQDTLNREQTASLLLLALDLLDRLRTDAPARDKLDP
jgi:hypothetical protein